MYEEWEYDFDKMTEKLQLDKEEILEALKGVFTTGIRRSGSWERNVLESIFCIDEDFFRKYQRKDKSSTTNQFNEGENDEY